MSGLLDRQAALERRHEIIEKDRKRDHAAKVQRSREETTKALEKVERIFIRDTEILLTQAYVRDLVGQAVGGEWGAFEVGGFDYPVCSARELVRFCNGGSVGTKQMGRFELVRVESFEDLTGGPGLKLGYVPEQRLRDGYQVTETNASISTLFQRSRREMARRHISGGVRPGGAGDQHFRVMPHVWVCRDGVASEGPVKTVEQAVPFEALVDHEGGSARILAVRSLKRDPEALAKFEVGPGAAAPFRLVKDRSGLRIETVAGAEATAVRIEDLDGFELLIEPKTRRVLEVRSIELEPEPEPDEDE